MNDTTPHMPPRSETILLPHPPDKIVDLLETAARRGKLPGFRRGRGDELFRITLFSEPFDHDLIGRVARRDNGSTELAIRVRLRRMLPIVSAAVVLITVWPGVWLTHSLLVTYSDWYQSASRSIPGLTYWWYLPLTIGPLPWAVRSIARRVRAGLAESYRAQVDALRAAAG